MINKNKRIELRFGLTTPGSMWNLLYEGMDQNINLRTTFKGKDEENLRKKYIASVKKISPGSLLSGQIDNDLKVGDRNIIKDNACNVILSVF